VLYPTVVMPPEDVEPDASPADVKQFLKVVHARAAVSIAPAMRNLRATAV
jgi:hypothetical protein